MRRWRASSPMRAQYERVKSEAAKKKVPFTISFHYFKTFCELTRYIERTGPFKHCMTIDRIDNLKGYEPGNIQPLTRAKNAEKRNKYDKIRMEKGYRWRRKSS
jgi:hypothetical protein